MVTTWNLTNHIRLDERGVAYVGNTRFKVEHVVGANLALGMTPEQMVEAYANCLSLSQIHAALAFYYDNRQALDAQWKADDIEVERLRQESQNSPANAKLREKLQANVGAVL